MILDELERLFARYGLREAFLEQEALFYWPRVVGPRIAALTEPLVVREGRLFVRVGQSVYAQELTAMRELYLERLNAHLKVPLQDVRFKVAALPSPPLPPAPAPPLEGVGLEPAERDLIRGAVRPVGDQRLREALRAWFETLQRVEKLKSARAEEKPCPGCGLHHPGPEELCPCCSQEGRR